MTFDGATDALLQHFKTRWESLEPGVPISFPNTKALSIDSESGGYVRITFVSTSARRVTVGGQTRIQSGEVVVNTFTPLNTGDGVASGYARTIESIWETAHDNGLSGEIHFGAPEPISQRRDPDIPAWRGGVAVPFVIDHTP